MFDSTIRVRVGGTVKEYPQDIAGYGEHIAAGGTTVGISTAITQAREFFKANRGTDWVKAVSFWVWMDDSGVAYHVDVNRHGNHTITGAAPMPGPNNVREVYTA